MLEREFQSAITDLCDLLGLRWWHDNDSRRNKAGLPDLIVVGPHGVLFRELKTTTGRVTPEQRDWLVELAAAGADADVWRPTDLQPAGGRIRAELVALKRPGRTNA